MFNELNDITNPLTFFLMMFVLAFIYMVLTDIKKITYIYRRRIYKKRYGIGLGKASVHLHFYKYSFYAFLPFWSCRKIRDNYGYVKVK